MDTTLNMAVRSVSSGSVMVPLTSSRPATKTLAATSRPMEPRHSVSRQMRPGWRLTRAMKYSAKLPLAISMKTIAIHSSTGDWKWPKLASWVDRPPRLMVVDMWAHASSADMPPSQ